MARAMGAEAVFNPSRVDLEAEVMAATDGDGVDVLLEMSGVASAIDQGFRLLHPGGEAALLGLFSRPITFDFDDRIVFKGATVHGIVGRRLWATWYQMRAMLRAHAVDLSPVVTHRFALEDFAAAFDLMASGACGKVVMFPDPADADGPLTPAREVSMSDRTDYLNDEVESLRRQGLYTTIRHIDGPQGPWLDGGRAPRPQLLLQQLPRPGQPPRPGRRGPRRPRPLRRRPRGGAHHRRAP